MIKVENFSKCGNQRIEVLLSNGQSFTVFVDDKTGQVSLLSNSPHAISKSYTNAKGYPIYVVPVSLYGHPFED